MLDLIVAALAGVYVTRCPERPCAGRLTWHCTAHQTRSIPLSLGVVGRW